MIFLALLAYVHFLLYLCTDFVNKLLDYEYTNIKFYHILCW